MGEAALRRSCCCFLGPVRAFKGSAPSRPLGGAGSAGPGGCCWGCQPWRFLEGSGSSRTEPAESGAPILSGPRVMPRMGSIWDKALCPRARVVSS